VRLWNLVFDKMRSFSALHSITDLDACTKIVFFRYRTSD
jgi:hypothetical protein